MAATAAAMVSCNARMGLNNGILITVPARSSSVEVEALISACGSARASSFGYSSLQSKKKKMTLSVGYSRIPSCKKSFARASLKKGEGGERAVREWASEKAVEAGPSVNTTDIGVDVKAEELSDSASYDRWVRDIVLDVASDTAIDTQAGVDEVAREDAEGISQELGRSVEDTVVALENKASEVADREVRKEKFSSAENPPVAAASAGSNSKDQEELKDSILDVASDAAVDNQPEVDAEAEKDAQGLVDKFGGSLKLTQMTIQNLAEVAANVESQRAGSDQGNENSGAAKRPSTIEEFTEAGVKIVKEGIDTQRPSIKDITKKIASGIRQGVEQLQGGVDGFIEIQTNLKQKAGEEAQATYSGLSEDKAQKELELQSEKDSDPISKMTQNYEHEVGNEQLGTAAGSLGFGNQDASQESLTRAADTDPVALERDDEWQGKSN
ncbi:unnamed protein product [Sphagnum troendelagicum]|uniref:Uncharacterized protein n=1 Tax=Sphagnum troendelagicum TaxID=128251 RepID=A0ABP0TE60_9BRYO